MHKPALRRLTSALIVSITVVAALAVFAPPAFAGKPIHFVEHRIGMICDEAPITNAFGTAVVAIAMSDVDTPYALGFFWEYPNTPENDEPTLRSDTNEDSVTGNANHLDGVFGMDDSLGLPAGNGVVSVNLAPAGPLEKGEGSRTGNRIFKNNSSYQPLVVTEGTFTLPNGVVFDLAGCLGFDVTIDIFMNQPDSLVQAFSGVLVLCDVVGENYTLELVASTDQNGTGGLLFFSGPDGTIFGEGSHISLTPEQFTGAFETYDDETGEPLGDAVVDATLSRLQRVVLDRSEGRTHSKITGWLLRPSGTITLPTEPPTEISLESCFALDGKQTIAEPHPRIERALGK